MALSQSQRTVMLKTPLDDDVLQLESMTVSDELGRLFEIELELLSEDHQVKLEDVLGKEMTVQYLLPDRSTWRPFHGFVASFSYAGSSGDLAAYRATLRPWFWFLTRTNNCRIFQEMTVPDIVKQIFRDHGFSDFEESLSGDYAERLYCVQYRESDFAFISRLLEKEGIYYYFKHEEGRHVLVLSDGYGSHAVAPFDGYDEIPFYPPEGRESRERDCVYDWSSTQAVQTGQFSMRDYDFTAPRKDLSVRRQVSVPNDRGEYEVYDYPGGYLEVADGETYSQIHIEEHQTEREVFAATSNAMGVMTGALFSLANYPRDDQNREYLIAGSTHRLTATGFRSGGSGGGTEVEYECTFATIASEIPFRPRRSTPTPVMQGPQTALVVGKSGEKVWTDEYGRIKVQFHWDREGAKDENSSCWCRVSQNRAGSGWGDVWLPHIGQEVIVSFLEGDPDQPIVTGRVYNQDNMPHLGLPDNQLKSILRDDYGNEIIFDANPGEEHIRIHSPHHRSSIELGKSIHYKTASDHSGIFLGNTYGLHYGHHAKCQVGTQASAFIGGKADFFLGASISLWIGFGVDLSAGIKASFNWGGRYDYNRSWKYSNTTGKEIKSNDSTLTMRSLKDITVDSEKDCRFIGGPNDNSIIKAGVSQIELKFGKNAVANATPSESKAKRKMVGAAVAGFVAAAGATVAATQGLAEVSNSQGADSSQAYGWQPIYDLDGTAFWATLGVSAVAAVAGTITAAALGRSINKKEEGDYKPDAKQDTTYSFIDLTETSSRIVQNDGSGSVKAMIFLKNDGAIEIDGNADIKIKTTGQLILDAGGGVIIEQNNLKNKDGSIIW